MKKILFTAFIVLLAGGLLSADRVGLRTVVWWDPVTVDINDEPETIGGYEVAISYIAADLKAGTGSPLKTVVTGPTVTETAISGLLTGLAKGYYRIWVRASDAVGNISGWSDPLDVEIDNVPPKAPGKPGVKVK
jgi:hypothetical protein